MEIREHRLIELYEKEYGIILTAEKAEEELSKLLQLYKLIYLTSKPLPKHTVLNLTQTIDGKPVPTQYFPWYDTGATRKIIR